MWFTALTKIQTTTTTATTATTTPPATPAEAAETTTPEATAIATAASRGNQRKQETHGPLHFVQNTVLREPRATIEELCQYVTETTTTTTTRRTRHGVQRTLIPKCKSR